MRISTPECATSGEADDSWVTSSPPETALMATHAPALGPELVPVSRQATMRGIVWRQFRRHPAALFALAVLGVASVLSLLAPIVSPYDPNALDLANRWNAPSAEHLFGTDKQGRDMLSRILWGGRISLSVGILAMAGSVLVGTVVGALAGFFGGRIDSALMRLTDFFLTFPQIFVLLFLSYLLRQANIQFFQGGFGNIVLVIAATSWMIVARLVRASFLKLREEEFVAAARSYGAGNARLVLVHILPNAVGPILVAGTRGVADAILTESGLSFLGYGIQPPTASWGNILQDAFTTIGVYPWLTVFPGVMIFITVLALNYLGDALRDALDPYKVVGHMRA
jgi:peptide/nickel transport system permease protein